MRRFATFGPFEVFLTTVKNRHGDVSYSSDLAKTTVVGARRCLGRERDETTMSKWTGLSSLVSNSRMKRKETSVIKNAHTTGHVTIHV